MLITFLAQQLVGLGGNGVVSILGVQGSISTQNMGSGQHRVVD